MKAMKKRSIIWLIPVFLLFLNTCTEKLEVPPLKHPGTADWNDLFSPDLSNALYPEGSWSLINGILSPRSDAEIWTNIAYDNFILDLEYLASGHANSGIFVYCSHIDDWVANSIEIQIGDDLLINDTIPPEIGWSGSIFGHLAPTKRVSKSPGVWNRITISCTDYFIYILMNNLMIIELDMRLYTSNRSNPDGTEIPSKLTIPLAELPTLGHIGFQGTRDASQVKFRNIKILELE